MKFNRPRIRTILILINLFILILPLASISLLRLYENTLIRKTESSLIAQSAFIAAIYKSRIIANESAATLPLDYGLSVKTELTNSAINNSASIQTNSFSRRDTATKHNIPMRWKPRYAKLNLSTDKIFSRPSDARTIKKLALAIEIKAGNETAIIMREAQTYTLSGMRITNASGIVVASTSADTGKSILHWPEVNQSLNGLYVSSLRKRTSNSPVPSMASISRGAGIRVFISAPIIYNDRIIASLVLSRTPATLAQAIYNNQAALILVMLALVVIVILLSIFTSYAISRPLQAVARQAKMVADGKTSDIEVLQSPRTIEVEDLSNAVVTMSKALEKRTLFIQDFASQVSHAFKTPLTAIQGAIELLKEHFDTMTHSERNQFLGNLDSDSKYLESLVNRLLDLARADLQKPFSEETNIANLISRIVERAETKNIEIILGSIDPDLTAAIPPAELESIFQNLIDNSMQHGKPPITININKIENEHRVDSVLEIILQDNGNGISQKNSLSIFTPFFTTAREYGGTGLGLAVIKTLLNNYNSTIELKKSDVGACFVIKLKTGNI